MPELAQCSNSDVCKVAATKRNAMALEAHSGLSTYPQDAAIAVRIADICCKREFSVGKAKKMRHRRA